jgi:signal transduction histidine kinase
MNLRAKTSLFITAFIVVIVLTLGYVHVKQEEKEQRDDLLSEGLGFATLTSTQLCFNYEKYYDKAFYTFVQYVKDLYGMNEDLYKIEIVDVNGIILLGFEEIETSSPVSETRVLPLSEWEYRTLSSVRPEYRYVKLDGRFILEISYPVLLQGGVHMHNVLYYFSFDALETRLSEMKKSTLRLTLLFIVIGFLGAAIFSYGLTRNLNDLVEHTNLMAKGDLKEPININSGDELGELASSFEYMRTEVLKKNDEIETYNKKLEEKVKERTTELEKLTEQLRKNNVILQKANEKLLELDKLKSEFLANTSHELRTPLTSIIGYSQCVIAELDGPLPEQHKKNVNKILSSGKDLLTLINRILDFSKIESGTLNFHKESLNIKNIIEESVTIIRPMSNEKGLSLITNIESDLPVINADSMRIKQAMINLLSNAVKFTDKGFIRINAVRNNGNLLISVSDTGIGIAKEDHNTIFEAFRQVDGSVHRKFGGSGLGLSISKKLIELHNGKLWLESEEGTGTTFSFTLPTDDVETSDEDQDS